LAAILRAEEHRRDDAIEALGKRDDAGARECMATVQRIAQIAEELQVLYQKWETIRPESASSEPPPLPRPKGGRSQLRAHLNGKVLECWTAAETFARTIEEIGIARVQNLGKALSGIPLIQTSPASGYQNQFKVGGFYICTHSNTRTKERLLNEIANELGIGLRVEIV